MIEGTCHCGAVRWRFSGIPESATACNCTVCRRYGALWAYDFEGEGRIHVSVRPKRTFGARRLSFISAQDAAAWRIGAGLNPTRRGGAESP